MTRKKGIICNACGGLISAPRRGVKLEQSQNNHNESCPAQFRVKEGKKK